MNILYVSVFSLFIGVLYCIVAGLMAVDIVPRKATGAALGIVGISSYVAAAIQDVVTGYLIEGGADKAYDFCRHFLDRRLHSFLCPSGAELEVNDEEGRRSLRHTPRRSPSCTG